MKGAGITQRGADPERVEEAKKVEDEEDRLNCGVVQVCELVPVELQPGDAVFFHSNLLHTSAQVLVEQLYRPGLCFHLRSTEQPLIFASF